MRRQTLILLTLFVGLAAASVLALRREPQRGMVRLRLAATDIQNTDRIVLTQAGAPPVVLTKGKQAAAWMLQNGHEADGQLVSSLLEEVAKINTSDMITQDTGRFADLNVEGDKALEVRLEKAGRKQAALFAGEATAPGMVYLREGDTVYRAQSMLEQMARRTESDWENRSMHQDAAEDLTAIIVAAAGHDPITLLRTATPDGATTWHPKEGTAPVSLRFDEGQAANLARAIASVRADRLIDADPGDGVTKLSSGDAITWTLATQGPSGHTLRLGAQTADRESERYAQLDGGGQLYTVGEGTAQSLLKSWAELRDLTVMTHTAFDNVRKVVLRLPGKSPQVAFTKKADGTFAPESPKGLPRSFVTDTHKVRQRAQQALLARALRFEGPERPRHGIGTSNSGAMVLHLTDGSQQTLTFGRALKGQEGSGYFARGSVGPDVYVISRALHDSLMGGLDGLAHKAPPGPGAGLTAQAGNGLTPEIEAQIRAQLAAAEAH